MKQIGNRKSAIGNRLAHPLPQGGTDFMSLRLRYQLRRTGGRCPPL